MDKQKTSDAIRAAIGAHGLCKLRLITAAHTGALPATADCIAEDDQCEFGRMLRSLEPGLAQDPDYREVRRMHAAFHENTARLARAIASGDTEDLAFELCDGGAFEQRSRAFKARLTDWRIKLVHRS